MMKVLGHRKRSWRIRQDFAGSLGTLSPRISWYPFARISPGSLGSLSPGSLGSLSPGFRKDHLVPFRQDSIQKSHNGNCTPDPGATKPANILQQRQRILELQAPKFPMSLERVDKEQGVWRSVHAEIRSPKNRIMGIAQDPGACKPANKQHSAFALKI